MCCLLALSFAVFLVADSKEAYEQLKREKDNASAAFKDTVASLTLENTSL